MNNVLKTRLLPFAGALILISTVACVDSPTSPNINGKRALRDTVPEAEGDSTNCKSGWQVVSGRIICNGDDR